MMSGSVLEGCGGDEDLISPKDGETTGSGGGVDAGLTNDCLEDGDGFVGAIRKLMTNRKFLYIEAWYEMYGVIQLHQ